MHKLSSFVVVALRREWQINMRHKGEWVAPLIFFVLIASIFPITLGGMQENLQSIAVCVIWISAMLATVLAQENLLRTDYKLGTFEQYISKPLALSGLIFAKICINWVVTALPLLLLCPLLGLSFSLPAKTIYALELTLLLGTPSLCLLAALGAALTVSLPRGGILLAIIILPLLMPVLVLGASAGIFSLQAINYTGQLALLGAIMLTMLLCIPFAISGAIRVSLI